MRIKLAILGGMAAALAFWPARQVRPVSPRLEACLETTALPAQIGHYRQMRREFRPVMGGMDIWAAYARPAARPIGGTKPRPAAPQAQIYLTYGVGPRAWHPWLQSYRLEGYTVLQRHQRSFRSAGGYRQFAVAAMQDQQQNRWLEATMRCQPGHCFDGPFQLWLAGWRAPYRPTVAVHVSVLLPSGAASPSPALAWFDRQLSDFIQAWSPAPLNACLAREENPS